MGDSREARLAAALYYMTHNSCPSPSTVTLPKRALPGDIPTGGEGRLLEERPGLKLQR